MEQNNKNIIPRPPIVVVMGHIDHGKSSILDYIRKANIVAKEAGGITQHIGAYEAEVKCGDPQSHHHKSAKLTFLDTPGHEAFSQMRLRGARVADVAILVVAADDGVKPQTIEAHNAIKEAGIPFVVAMNKMDRPGANPDAVKKQLTEKGVYVEGWGGNIPCIGTVAKTGEGIQELLDMVLLLAEMENLTGDVSKSALGVVIESHLDPKRGITSTLLITDGTIKKGMFAVSGEAMAPVRIFENFLGKPLEEATFSSPIKIVGFDRLPEVGAPFLTFESKTEAEQCSSENCAAKARAATGKKHGAVGSETVAVLPLLIKTDVSGSLEALEKEIKKLEKEDIKIDIVRDGIGKVSENDVKIISGADKPLIIGFNVGVEDSAKTLAERFGIEIFLSDVIYRVSEWLEEKMEPRKPKLNKEVIVGEAKILKTFSRAKNKQVVGGRVVNGKIMNGAQIVIKRREVEISRGHIEELQQNKMKTGEVTEGEFGMMAETKMEIAPGDMVEIMGKMG